MLSWFREKVASAPALVVTGPGVFKTRNVEAKFRDERGSPSLRGKLGQDGWSDGQERFTLRLRGLPDAPCGPIQLYRGSRLVAEFDHAGARFEFEWKGYRSTSVVPEFEIGDLLTIEVGDVSLSATVQAD